jgi:membrane protein implicated in regulation of membrane protease activity
MRNGKGLTLTLVLGALGLLAVLGLALRAAQGSATDDSAAVGFPVVLVVLLVVSVVGALVWRSVDKKRQARR